MLYVFVCVSVYLCVLVCTCVFMRVCVCVCFVFVCVIDDVEGTLGFCHKHQTSSQIDGDKVVQPLLRRFNSESSWPYLAQYLDPQITLNKGGTIHFSDIV